MKKLLVLFIVGVIVFIFLGSFTSSSPLTLPNAPAGYSGAPIQNRTCRNCHSDFALNTPGGNVIATGLPVGSYIAGKTYDFSITITNAAPAAIWSFALKAVLSGTSGTALGTFSTTNPNVHIASSEIKTSNAVVSSGSSYTYTGLKWIAPGTGASAVSFYMTGIAGNDDGAESGDYVYSNSILNIVMPVVLGDFTVCWQENQALLKWNSLTEVNAGYYTVERSYNGIDFEKAGTVDAAGNSAIGRNYSYTDKTILPSAGKLYYRLLIVDKDGKGQYSKVIVLSNTVDTYLDKIYPSVLLTGGMLHIDVVSKTGQVCNIEIFNSGGQKIRNGSWMLKKGINNIEMKSFNGFATGIYYFKIATENFSRTVPVIFQ